EGRALQPGYGGNGQQYRGVGYASEATHSRGTEFAVLTPVSVLCCGNRGKYSPRRSSERHNHSNAQILYLVVL
ncbi:MAG: hypothetical protein AVDCRST_MAG03-745, partial [uncultured Rubrobacteraceae bacterium]